MLILIFSMRIACAKCCMLLRNAVLILLDETFDFLYNRKAGIFCKIHVRKERESMPIGVIVNVLSVVIGGLLERWPVISFRIL